MKGAKKGRIPKSKQEAVSVRAVDPRFAKGVQYRKVLEEINGTGVCPFCPAYFKWHTKPILKRAGGWLITENFNPYKNAAIHLLLVKKDHAESIENLVKRDWSDVAALTRWAAKHFHIRGGAFAMRFGENVFTGATVRHIHAHLIVPRVVRGRARPVMFPVG